MKTKSKGFLIAFVLILLLMSSCGVEQSTLGVTESQVEHPEWSYNLSIYEVNLRQYSPAGTFVEFEKHLTRLKDMDIGILWFMPIHPIGEKNRKGSLGSYYSVKDYLAVNPEHGTLDEFKSLVNKIHDLGMYVIIDWVANHTAWDNPLTLEHPDWYTRDENGSFVPPVADWADVIDLNYDNAGLREYMISALKFWVEETDIDGFRCDVAEMVPIDFWNAAQAELDKIKPVFMLAEGAAPELHEQGFDMTYSWDLFNLTNGIAIGSKGPADIDAYLDGEAVNYPDDAFRMYFTSNHDENSWNGTVFERLGGGVKTFAVLAATLNGMPRVYSGQEAGLNKRLDFFEKDPIDWRDHELTELYTTLFDLKKTNTALRHGDRGGPVVRVKTSNDDLVYSFIREKEDDRVFVVLNLSGDVRNITFSGQLFAGDYTDVFGDSTVSLSENSNLELEPWGHRVFEGR